MQERPIGQAGLAIVRIAEAGVDFVQLYPRLRLRFRGRANANPIPTRFYA